MIGQKDAVAHYSGLLQQCFFKQQLIFRALGYVNRFEGPEFATCKKLK